MKQIKWKKRGKVIICGKILREWSSNKNATKNDKFKKYENQIATWNHLLKQFVHKYNYNLIEIDKLFRHKKDFTNDIEPSYQGGKLLVNKIINI